MTRHRDFSHVDYLLPPRFDQDFGMMVGRSEIGEGLGDTVDADRGSDQRCDIRNALGDIA